MALAAIGLILSAVAEMEIQAGWDSAKRHAAVQTALRKLGLDFDPQAADFEYVYTYALVSFGVDNPSEMVEFLLQPRIRLLFRRAFATGDISLAEKEIADVSDWPALEKLYGLDVSARSLMMAFHKCFSDAVDRARSVVEVRQDQKLGQLLDGQAKMQQEMASLRDLMPPVLSREGKPESRLPKEQLYHSQIDQARDLIREDKADAALSALLGLRAKLQAAGISTDLSFRLLTNIGASYLVLGRDEEAVPYFEGALALKPGDPLALSNAALAEIVKGRFEEAIALARRALATEPGYALALSALVQALDKAERFEQLDDGTRSSAEESAEGRRALALVLLQQEEYEEAERLLRLSVTLGSAEPQDYALLAQAILGPIQSARWNSPVLPWDELHDEVHRLEEAESLLTHVVEAWQLLANRRRFHSVLGSRVNARALQRKFRAALEDCQRILVEDPQHPQALYNAGLLSLEIHDPYHAIEYFLEYRTDPAHAEQCCVPLAAAYLQSGQPREAIGVLLEASEDGDGPFARVSLDRLVLIAQAAHMVGDVKLLSDTAQQLGASPKDDPLALEALGTVCLLQGKDDEAVSYLQNALELAEGSLKARITFELAEAYYACDRYGDAVPLYARLSPKHTDTPLTRRYVVCLLNSGSLDLALDIAQEARGGGDPIPVLSEVEARVLEYIGDLEPALDLYMHLAELQPDNHEHLLRAASIYTRLGSIEDAVAIVEPVAARSWDNPDALLSIAKILANAGCPGNDVLRLAYRARRLKMDEPEIHLAYIGLFMKVEDDESLNLKPGIVGVGDALQLSSERETLWYTILRELPADRGRGELLFNDPLAQRLLGLTVGNTLQLHEGPYDQPTYNVTEIQSKYVRAFQESFLGFSSWFPDHQGLHRFEVVDGDVSPMLRVTEIGFRLQKERQSLYASRQITLEALAQLGGVSVAEAWSGMISGDGQIIASLGTVEERAYHADILQRHSEATIDLLALLTLAHVGLMDLLKILFERVYVAQAVIDVLTEDVARLRQFGEREHHVIGRADERYTFQRIPREMIVHNVQYLEQIAGFIRQNCEIKPTSGALEFGQEEFERSEFAFGRSSFASALVARDTGSLLWSDDYVLRTICRQWLSVDACWTQPVLLCARDRDVLSMECYYGAVEELALANYHYVSLNSGLIMYSLRQRNWIVDAQLERVLGPLSDPGTDLPVAVRIIAQAICSAWAEAIPYLSKQHILDLCLRTLARNRDREIATHLLEIALQKERQLQRHQLLRLTTEIRRWLTVHQRLGI